MITKLVDRMDSNRILKETLTIRSKGWRFVGRQRERSEWINFDVERIGSIIPVLKKNRGRVQTKHAFCFFSFFFVLFIHVFLVRSNFWIAGVLGCVMEKLATGITVWNPVSARALSMNNSQSWHPYIVSSFCSAAEKASCRGTRCYSSGHVVTKDSSENIYS